MRVMGPAESWPLLLPLELERAFLCLRRKEKTRWELGTRVRTGGRQRSWGA